MSNIMKSTKDELMPFVAHITGKTDKALDDIVFNIAGCLIEAEVSVKTYITAYKNDSIFNAVALYTNNAILSDFFAEEFKYLGSLLYSRRCVGIGTPNAACGEGELMAIACSPSVRVAKKKNEGDLYVNGNAIELKGSSIRVYSDATGKQLHEAGLKLAKQFGFENNKSNIR